MVKAEEIRSLMQEAEAGDADSQTGLGLLYSVGIGVAKDLTASEKWLRKAANQGSSESMFWLGFFYDRLEKYDKAAKWYREAAAKGLAKAQSCLANLYRLGQGVKLDYKLSAQWYLKAALQGFVSAQVDLGYQYDRGEGVEQDYEEAFYWFRRAADEGITEGQFNLALMYHLGKCVKQSNSKAMEWYRKAAEQGYMPAQYNLGLMYYRGLGSGEDEDLEKAHYWMFIASQSGDKEAKRCLKEIEEEFSKEQKRKLRAKARKWLREREAQRAYIIRVPDHPIFKRVL